MHFPNHYLLRCGDYTLQPALSRRYVSASTHRCGSEIHRCRFRLSPCCACIFSIGLILIVNPWRQKKRLPKLVGYERFSFLVRRRKERSRSLASLKLMVRYVLAHYYLKAYNWTSQCTASLRPHQFARGYSLASLFKWDHISPEGSHSYPPQHCVQSFAGTC